MPDYSTDDLPQKPQLKGLLLFTCMYVLLEYTCMHTACIQFPEWSEEGTRSPGVARSWTGFPGRAANAIEPSLQSHESQFKVVSFVLDDCSKLNKSDVVRTDRIQPYFQRKARREKFKLGLKP